MLLHGDAPESGWRASWLSDEGAARLLALLKRLIPDAKGYGLIADLERRQRS